VFDHTPANPPVDVGECTLELLNPTQDPDHVNYRVEATFDEHSKFADCFKRIIAYPPEATCELPVSKRP